MYIGNKQNQENYQIDGSKANGKQLSMNRDNDVLRVSPKRSGPYHYDVGQNGAAILTTKETKSVQYTPDLIKNSSDSDETSRDDGRANTDVNNNETVRKRTTIKLVNGSLVLLEDYSHSCGSKRKKKLSPDKVTIKRPFKTTQERMALFEILQVPQDRFSTAAFAVFVIAVLCFGISYNGDFIFDDRKAITENRDVLPETPLLEIFQNDFWGERLTSPKSIKSYRPITVLSFRLSYYLGGGFYPVWFHIPNILLHAIISVLILRVFTVLFYEYQTAQEKNSAILNPLLLCSLLFAVHPVHTECVAGLVGRADLLCALFFLMSFLFYVRSCAEGSQNKEVPIIYRPSSFSVTYMTASMLMCFLSVFCKEQGLTVLGICSVYDIVVVCHIHPLQLIGLKRSSTHYPYQENVHKRTQPYATAPWISSLIERHVFLLLTGLVTMWLRLYLMGPSPPYFIPWDNPHSFENGTLIRGLNYNYIYSVNAWLLVHPWWLCCDWSMGCIPVIKAVSDLRIFGGVAFWIVLGTLLFICLKPPFTRNKRVLIMSLAFMIVPFLPASNLFFRVGFVIAERMLYLPSLGFCMLVVIGVRRICVAYPKQAQAVKIAVYFLICISVIRCIQRSAQWRKAIDLFVAGEKVCPLNAKIHYSIGYELNEMRKSEEAIERYRLAIKLEPQYHDAINNLGVLLRDKKDFTESEMLLKGVVELKEDYELGWINLGLTKEKLKKFAEAEMCYLKALEYFPDHLFTHFCLGRLYYNEMHMHDKAVEVWWNATAIQPNEATYWYNIAAVLYNQGKYEETVEVIQQAFKHVPRKSNMLSLLALVCKKQGRWEKSEALYLEAIKLKPSDHTLYASLGALYEDWRKYALAEKYYRTALKINPDDTRVKGSLGNVLRKTR